MSYDFTTLSPDEFERFVGDLFSAEYGVQLEIFKRGRDGGIDLRHSRVALGTPETIYQCKRYAPHKLPELMRSMEKERPNLDAIKPARYVLATSVELPPANKDALLRLLQPHIKTSADIYGAAELNGLLGRHREVELAHFKLWISSTNILEQILHARIFNVTNATLDSVKGQMARLVVHDAYQRTLDLLEENHHCVIAGNPGIGKTTLARMLMCQYLQSGFSPLVVVGDISDAWSTITRAREGYAKHVVFYDDFLGTFRFEEAKFSKNEDASLLNFVETTRKSPNLRFILTTREYIIADAMRLHGTFAQHAQWLARSTVSLNDYNYSVRARVLFNHLYFSDLPEFRLRAILKSSLHKEIIYHAHFNPRFIENICSPENTRELTDPEYISHVRRKFNDPSELWQHPFENQISPTARQILALLWSFGGTAEFNVLKQSLSTYQAAVRAPFSESNYKTALKELNGNFVTVSRYPHASNKSALVNVIRFQNPSVEQFIERTLRQEPLWSESLAKTASHFAQISTLVNWIINLSVYGQNEVQIQPGIWLHLYERGQAVERIEAGRLTRTRSSSELVYSPSDALSALDRTYTLLRIRRNLRTPDQSADLVMRRITTLQGWRELLQGLPSQASIGNATLRLIEHWLYTGVQSVEFNSMRRVFTQVSREILAGQETWPAGLTSLGSISSSIQTVTRKYPTAHATSVARLLRHSVDELLTHEQNINVLKESAAALIHRSNHWPLDPDEIKLMRDALAQRIDAIEETHRQDYTPVQMDRIDSGTTWEVADLDELFEELLER